MSDTDRLPPGPSEAELRCEIARLNKMVRVLMDRIEKITNFQGTDFNIFQTNIFLEDQVRRRTGELEAAMLGNESILCSLREAEYRNRLLVENAPLSIHVIGMEGDLISMNRAGLSMFGFAAESDAEGYPFLGLVVPGERDGISGLMERARGGESLTFNFSSVKDGGLILQSCFIPIRDRDGKVGTIMGIAENITDRMNAERQIRHLAFNDALTDIPNWRLFNDRLSMAMETGGRSGRYGAVMFLGLDDFKAVNRTYGFDGGDLLLVEVASRISRSVRKIDTVARLGGDEFAVLLNELDTDAEDSLAQAAIIAENLRNNLAEPYGLKISREGGLPEISVCRSTVSIGISLFQGCRSSREEVLKKADAAMSRAKSGGRNAIRFYERQ
jgi:diguanylate cyclase (GGDEF)-like protein/PAS domain S-box-containing protein